MNSTATRQRRNYFLLLLLLVLSVIPNLVTKADNLKQQACVLVELSIENVVESIKVQVPIDQNKGIGGGASSIRGHSNYFLNYGFSMGVSETKKDQVKLDLSVGFKSTDDSGHLRTEGSLKRRLTVKRGKENKYKLDKGVMVKARITECEKEASGK